MISTLPNCRLLLLGLNSTMRVGLDLRPFFAKLGWTQTNPRLGVLVQLVAHFAAKFLERFSGTRWGPWSCAIAPRTASRSTAGKHMGLDSREWSPVGTA